MHTHKKNFIGKHIIVTDAPNNSIVGVSGLVIDETKETFVVDQEGEHKTIIKTKTTFVIDDETVNGDDITKTIQERIKSKRN